MSSSLRCVVDASVAIKQYIPDPLSEKAKQLFEQLNYSDTEFFIPDLFYVELANIIWKYVRAGLYAAEDVSADLAALRALPLQVVSCAELIEEATKIGIAHSITVYDSCYVALAQKVSAPLLTLDQKLVNALSSSAYNVQSFTTFTINK
ncbi:MAG: type II toxin-antitoxin system VapC family toxin [Waterburya sp.]